MSATKGSQKGFSVVEGVVIVLVVAVLAVGGWWVWEKNRTKVGDAASNNSSSGSQNEQDHTTPPEGQNIVKVPELGIKISAPDYAKDLVYEVRSGKLGDGRTATFAFFSTQSLLNSKTECSLVDTSFGSLGKVDGQYPTVTDENRNAIAIEYGILVKQFPTYYISRGVPNGGGECQADSGEDSSAPSPPESTWRSAFADIASSTEELKN